MDKPTTQEQKLNEEFERELDRCDKLEAIEQFFGDEITLGELCGRFDILR